ncbi:hypothetical protein E2C01_009926 [Portunus trituberculatus]|uniref:Uncharacterized protein n=1 Tax=Portunus trituberculatus TaxID=210409 RepID=A0A5B7D704_PORTR|nr:hypothetical protein [Portunus trituberculatus]
MKSHHILGETLHAAKETQASNPKIHRVLSAISEPASQAKEACLLRIRKLSLCLKIQDQVTYIVQHFAGATISSIPRCHLFAEAAGTISGFNSSYKRMIIRSAS